MRAPVATAIAVAVGLIVLLGYFLPIAVLQSVNVALVSWAVGIAGMAILVGIIQLVLVHWRRLANPQQRDLYSPLLVLAFLITAGAGLALGPAHPQFTRVVTAIQVPVEAGLMATLAIVLAYAALRLSQRRKGWMTLVFIASAIVFILVGSSFLAIGSAVPWLKSLREFLAQIPIAGGRGILLGIALGSLMAGLRIIMGVDRPYSG